MIFQGFPGGPKSQRALQLSSRLLFDVFRRYDPENPFLQQAQREVLTEELDSDRLEARLRALSGQPWQSQRLASLSPFAFPLWATRVHARYSSESAVQRIARMLAQQCLPVARATTEVHPPWGRPPSWLLPEKAVLWDRTLFCADVHLGESELFQRQGFAVPKAVTPRTWRASACSRGPMEGAKLVVLGDSLPAPPRKHWPGLPQGLARRPGTDRGFRDSRRRQPRRRGAPGRNGRATALAAGRLASGASHLSPWFLGDGGGTDPRGAPQTLPAACGAQDQPCGPVFWRRGQELHTPRLWHAHGNDGG